MKFEVLHVGHSSPEMVTEDPGTQFVLVKASGGKPEDMEQASAIFFAVSEALEDGKITLAEVGNIVATALKISPDKMGVAAAFIQQMEQALRDNRITFFEAIGLAFTLMGLFK